jgi:hypothetical protein
MKIPPKRACSGKERITKNYLLSVLPSRPDPNYVVEVSTGNLVMLNSIEELGVRQEIKNGLYKKKYMPIETAEPRKLLLNTPDSDWKVTNFNAYTREICFSIKGKNFSYTIPNYFWK